MVCRQLGFSAAGSLVTREFGPGRGRIWLDQVNCKGKEEEITECKHPGWGKTDCTHREDVGVKCANIRLTDGGRTFGRLEVYHLGEWGQ